MSVTANTDQLSEPAVLAHTKQRLFPEISEGSYVVTDTQFAAETWNAGIPIKPQIHEILSPFNHVELGSGYPDLVGVGSVDPELLAVDRFGQTPPLIAVEAKGYTASGTVDTERGIVQAHDRLSAANVAYMAAPSEAITQTDRVLARNLNVGVLAVSASGSVTLFEAPRVVGNQSTDAASAIRFQASAQGVTDNSFSLNHPKNYLGYPIALAADGDTDALLKQYQIVNATAQARRGASHLNLIDTSLGHARLTPLGKEVVRFAVRQSGSIDAALSEFESWYRSRKRFCELAPAWGELARRVLFAYRGTTLIIEELQQMHTDGFTEPSLTEFVSYLHTLHPTFTIELFIKGTEAARRRVLTPEGNIRRAGLKDGEVYHSPTVFQLKTMLYHAGFLTDRGREPHRLDPQTDVWALCEPITV